MGNLCGDGGGEKKQKIKGYKMLLIGSGECGKSTFYKQMKQLYSEGIEDEEMEHYKNSIYANVLETIARLSKKIEALKLKFDSEENKKKAENVMKIMKQNTSLLLNAEKVYTAELAKDLKILWKDKTIQKTFINHRYECHIFDGAEYFFADLSRLDPPNYVPNFQDILRCRRKTTGVYSINIEIDGVNLNFTDVGGQRSERKKWMNFYEGVDCLIFVASLSDYDQKLYEDDETNRMKDSMDEFDKAINGRFFCKTPIILFLNKTDVFKKKITKRDLKEFFSKYDGGSDFEKAKMFVDKEYKKLNKFDPDRIHTIFTQATDAENVKETITKVKDIVVKNIEKQQ